MSLVHPRLHLPGLLSWVKQQTSDMAMNGNGIHDMARVLQVNPTTVIEKLKKHRHLESVN